MGPKGLEPSPTGLKVRRAAITPRPQNVGRAYPFQSCLIHACAPRSSGSPGSRTQHYAVISRVRATGPRLPFANVVIRQVGTAGLEPALSCSQGTRAAAALHPVNPVRTGGFEPPISWSPTRRDARLRYVLSQVARAGVEPASTPTMLRTVPEGRDPVPIDERAIKRRAPSTQSKQGLARRFHVVDWAVLESASTAFQAAAKPSQLPVQQKSPM